MVKLFITVLNMSLGASVCIGAVMALRLLLKQAPKIFSYLLWVVVLIRLVCPVLPEAKFGVLSEMDFIEEIASTPKEVAYLRYLIVKAGEAAIFVGNGQMDGSVGKTYGYVPGEASGEPVTVEVDIDTALGRTEDVILGGSLFRLPLKKLIVLATCWAIIALGLCIYAIVGYVLFIHNVDKKKVTTPFVAGLIHPRIYLPDGLNDVQKQLVQEHEQIHISRLDYLVKPIAFLVCCIYWFNPLVWVSFFLMERDMEASCDEAVIRKIGYDKRKDYANTLLGISQSRGWRAGYPIAFGENHVKSRIKGVVKMKKAGIGAIVGGAVLVLAAAVLLLVNQPKEEASDSIIAEASGGGAVETSSSEMTEATYYFPDEQISNSALEPESETEGDGEQLSNSESAQSFSVADVKIYEYYTSDNLPEDSNQSYIASAEGNQETIMNYDPNRARDQYEVLVLPQPDEAFDSFGILFSYPVEGARISDGFGSRINPTSGDILYHLGIDFAAEEGTEIMAAADGIVVKTGFDAECGNYVILLHENGDATYYFHCKEIMAEEGKQVKRGEQIATVGKTGRATGTFVHFAVSRSGKYIEPEFVD